MFNENVKKVLTENMWDVATCSDGEPNVVPVAFKDVTEDGKLVYKKIKAHWEKFSQSINALMEVE